MKHRHNNSRKGTIAILSCFLLIAVLGMVAFAVDLGYMANSQTELQRTVDATALAACSQLQNGGTPGSSTSAAANLSTVSTPAATYAAANKVCGSSPTLGDSDVVVGYMANPGPGGTIDTSGSANNYNAVQITVHRSADQNGLVPAFFSKIYGNAGEAASATATAAFISNFSGFGLPTGGGVSGGSSGGNLMFLPYSLDLDTWNALLTGTGSDNWKWDTTNQRVVAGSDGILECNLFPQGTGSPGNRGTVCIGGNGTSTLVRQIQYGLSASDLQGYGGVLALDSTGNLYLPAKPGISAGTKSALAAIIGQTRIIPIFNSVSGTGANANYDIVQFAGVRVLDVNLTGSMSTKHLTVQPAWFYARGAIAATSSGSGNATQNT